MCLAASVFALTAVSCNRHWILMSLEEFGRDRMYWEAQSAKRRRMLKRCASFTWSNSAAEQSREKFEREAERAANRMGGPIV